MLSLLLSGSIAVSALGVLYDIDFASHEVGQPPYVSEGEFPRDAPSLIYFGEPRIVESLGSLSDHVLELDWRGQELHLESVVLRLSDAPVRAERLRVDLDLYVEALAPSHPSGRGSAFSILFFNGDMNGVRFLSDGVVLIDYFDEESATRETETDTYELRSMTHVEITIDRRAETFCASIDERSSRCVRLGPGEASHIKLGVMNVDGFGRVGIDNIEVVGE